MGERRGGCDDEAADCRHAGSLSRLRGRVGEGEVLKRGIMGSFHKVSPKYLPLYVAEFAFRYNNRDNADIFGAAVSRC
jgi:hypothetical protein